MTPNRKETNDYTQFLKKRLQVVDFEDCFKVIKPKDFIRENKKQIAVQYKSSDG